MQRPQRSRSAARTWSSSTRRRRGCTRCPLHAGPHEGRVRGRQRRRRPDVRRRGARRSRRTCRACRSSAGRASCSTSCWARSAWSATTCSSPTSLKCRPPGNRDPQPEEIEACKPLPAQADRADRAEGDLHARQLRHEAADPHASAASRSVHGRPQVHELGGRTVRVYPLFHPAAALRSTKTLEELREDFAACRAARGAAAGADRGGRAGAGGRGRARRRSRPRSDLFD